MSDAPQPRKPAKKAAAVPEDLDEVAIDATLVKSPRFARFLWTGAFLGILLGVGVSILMPGAGADYRATVAILMALGMGTFGGLIGGVIGARSHTPLPRAQHARRWDDEPPATPGEGRA